MSNINKDSLENNSKIEEVKITPVMESRGVVSEKEKEMINEYAYIIEAVASVITAKKSCHQALTLKICKAWVLKGYYVQFVGSMKIKSSIKTYANIRVRGAMLDLIRKEWRAKSSSKHEDFKAPN